MLGASLPHVDSSVSHVDLGVQKLSTDRADASCQLNKNRVSVTSCLRYLQGSKANWICPLFTLPSKGSTSISNQEDPSSIEIAYKEGHVSDSDWQMVAPTQSSPANRVKLVPSRIPSSNRPLSALICVLRPVSIHADSARTKVAIFADSKIAIRADYAGLEAEIG